MSKMTELLQSIGSDQRTTVELFSLVYDELRRLAAAQLTREAPGNTLQPTALVHEAYLRLVRGELDVEDSPRWQNRAQFFAAAAVAMRRILIDAARRKKCVKHAGGLTRERFDLDLVAGPEIAADLLALDSALDELARQEPEVAALVQLRFFGGLSVRQAAELLGVTSRTAGSYWAYARVWLEAEVRRAVDAVA